MKVALNLSMPESPRKRYALAWALPAVLVGLGGLVSLSLSAVRTVREYQTAHNSFLKLQEGESRLREREMALRRDLERPQFRVVYREAQFVNKLIEEKKGMSLTEMAAKVAKLLPGQVRLTGLALAPQGGDLVVHFTITGRNEEAVETFLSSLEDSPDFKDVTIANRGFEQEGGQSAAVNIACAARYVAGNH
jgi:Tfp pilus assembly protein PilN